MVWKKQPVSSAFGYTTFNVLMATQHSEARFFIVAMRWSGPMPQLAEKVWISLQTIFSCHAFGEWLDVNKLLFSFQDSLTNCTTVVIASPSWVVLSSITPICFPSISCLMLDSSSFSMKGTKSKMKNLLESPIFSSSRFLKRSSLLSDTCA